MPQINVIPQNKKMLEGKDDTHVEFASPSDFHWKYPVALKMIGDLHFATDYQLTESTGIKDVLYGLFEDKKFDKPITAMHVTMHDGAKFGLDVKEVPVVEMVVTKESERGKGYARFLYEAVLNRHKILISGDDLYTDEGKTNKTLGLWLNHLPKLGNVANIDMNTFKIEPFDFKKATNPYMSKRIRFVLLKEGVWDKLIAALISTSAIAGTGYVVNNINTDKQPHAAVQDFKSFYGDETPKNNEPKITAQEPEKKVETAPEKKVSNDISVEKLREMLKKHEGFSNKVYKDTKGIETIGIGFNLKRKDAPEIIKSLGKDYNKILTGKDTLTDEQINKIFNINLKEATASAKRVVKNFDSLPAEAKMVVIDLIFNMGEAKLKDFKNFLGALEKFDFKTSANELLYKDSAKKEYSKWWKQVTNNHGSPEEVKKKNPDNRGVTILQLLSSISK